jgi:heat shock protein HslJ
MKKIVAFFTFLAVAVFVFTAGCAPAVPAAPPAPAVPLEKTSWVLQSFVESGAETPALAGTTVTAVFDPARGQVAGKAGCNNYFGGYKLDGGRLTMPGPLGSTMMACQPPVMEQESKFLKAFQSAQGYGISGDKLTINCGATQLVFRQG